MAKASCVDCEAAARERDALKAELETVKRERDTAYRAGLIAALQACEKTEKEIEWHFKKWGSDSSVDDSGGALRCQIAIEALLTALTFQQPAPEGEHDAS